MSSCTEKGKSITQQKISNPNYNTNEIRNPEQVISEKFGFEGDIISPKVYSPNEFMYRHSVTEKEGTLLVLRELETAEKVARRQYDELLMFSELKEFIKDIIGIRNDEQEHEEILACIRHRLVGQQIADET
jgi:hypothetical protein